MAVESIADVIVFLKYSSVLSYNKHNIMSAVYGEAVNLSLIADMYRVSGIYTIKLEFTLFTRLNSFLRIMHIDLHPFYRTTLGITQSPDKRLGCPG